jgi:hypothetical protein
MKISKLTIGIFVTLFVVVGVFILWALLGQKGPSSDTTTPSPTGGFTGVSQVAVTIPNGEAEARTQKIGQSYSEFFSELWATKVNFVPVTNGSGPAGSVYAMYAADITESQKSFPQEKTFSINIALVDVTDDDVVDAIVYNTLPGACGSAGCPLTIYKKDKNNWVNIFNAQTVGEIGLSNTITSGHVDLILTVQSGIRYPHVVTLFVWDGKTYQANNALGYWNNGHIIKR